MSTNDNLFKYICVVCYLAFLLPRLFCNAEFEFISFHNTEHSSGILILKIEMLLEFQNSWICLCFVWYRFGKYGFVRYTFRFFRYKHAQQSFCFSTRPPEDVFKACLQNVFNKYLQDVFKTCVQDVFKTCVQDVLKRLQHYNFLSFKTSSRRLQDGLGDFCKTSWKTKNYYVEDVLKTSSRHILKTTWRRLEDQQMFAG